MTERTKASYFLNKGSRIIASNTFTDSFDETWSGSSASEAQAEAKSDDQIMLEQITALAGPIVSAISPHKEVWSFELQGGTDGLSRGIQYYKEGLYSQADAYWKQVADQSSSIEEKAAANYNLGVLKVHEKQYQAAFAKFREADRLQPANRVYMEALRAVEVAEIGRKSLEVEKSMTKSANETGSKSDKRSKKRK